MLCLILLLILPLTLPVPARAEDGFDLSVPGLRIGVESGSVQAQLVEKLGGEVAGILVLLELAGLNGRELLKDYKVYSAVSYPGK